ncbi:ABC transporter substrate-binding protein [Desulfosarcina ovata]|uniref:Iron ABC transporter substrate-binding protein n=1 Tax=Desulfosarcina ovata subsp. ovata TaxID=2752305 RepID=A0A5K8AFE6_9BACT|nr:ABC transporter substrate-binding protein [Desulfosarcina ovata]BBO91301.1 iron ABC transporter substrate-binding protein [Desulfosarcina ovata subsp. ovata]
MNSNHGGRLFSTGIVVFAISIGALLFGRDTPAEATRSLSTIAETIRIEDSKGVSVAVRLPVRRLVVLTSDALEIVRALGAVDFVVGVYSDIEKNPLFWPTLKDRPKVGSWKAINYERVVELHPDAVLCYAQRPGREMEKKLEPFGIQVIRLDFFRIERLAKEIETLGRILEREKRAGALSAWYRRHLHHQRDMLKTITACPRVYIEGDSNYHTAGPGSGGNDMCLLAGGCNLAAKLSIPYPEVSPEWVVTGDPDVIVKITTRSICDSCYSMTERTPLKNISDRLMARPAWRHIGAVKKGRVHVIANEIWTGPRAIIGTSYLVKWFYPELSTEFDPEALHREYLESFQGIRHQGIYVYPE